MMSYWIALEDENGPVQVESFEDGGTYVVGGSTEADLNVTYNYARHFPFRDLHGQKARDTGELLLAAVQRLGTECDPDYWAPTEGNTGHACSILLAWAEQHPDATWRVN
jgi:hypothetical protein